MEHTKIVITETINTNNYIVSKVLETLSDEHFFERPSGTSNPIHYLIGHLSLYRFQICNLMGDKSTYKFADLYAMGKEIQEKSAYPSADEIKLEWEIVSKKLESLLAKVDDTLFEKEISKKYPIGNKTVLGALQFMMYHEAYHVGQITIVGRYFGYDAVIG